jgi:hypothetical protein
MFWTVAKLAPMSVAIYPFAALMSWLMKLVAWFMSPVIATVSMITGKNEVGGWLAYLYTHDASLDGGVEAGLPGYEASATGFRLWWQRVRWVCRNPAYRFNAYVLGFAAEGSVLIFEAGDQWPNFRYWTVMRSAGGWHFFGYRGKNDRWFGWNYMAYAGRHQIKSKPF